MKRVALYARVSTADKNQDPETQLRPMREYITHRGFAAAGEYIDHASGRRDDRSRYQELLAAVRKREIDVVVVWRYDRFARSTQALINALGEFNCLGIDFISLQEGTDTTTPQGKLVFTIMAGLAEFESSLISERVRAGMARAQGKRTNRPSISQSTRDQIIALRAQGHSVRAISQEIGVSVGTVSKYVSGSAG